VTGFCNNKSLTMAFSAIPRGKNGESIPIVTDDYPFLLADKSDFAANRQQKIFALVNQGHFQSPKTPNHCHPSSCRGLPNLGQAVPNVAVVATTQILTAV
jgi:hypothetical protein